MKFDYRSANNICMVINLVSNLFTSHVQVYGNVHMVPSSNRKLYVRL